jgi:hypothetical protein
MYVARIARSLMVTYEHTESGHTKRVTITRGDVGWEIREEHDSEVVRTSRCTDWHRVERAIRAFEDRSYSTNR